MHIVKQNKKTATTTTLVVKKFFHPKSNQEKLVHQSLGFSDASKQKTTRPTVAAAPIQNPVFTAMYPLMIQFF